MEHWRNDSDRRNEMHSEKIVWCRSLCPAQIPNGMDWDPTRVSAVKVRRLIAWTMLRTDLTKL